ncbi:ABC transporter ATP-binding protein [Aquabacter cavernae]|uniref:ABC transporter ATP-binding protein n=1 Tax=Aquabacter cavernae TaxID=2496029 RepID=UPI001FE11ECA|nr:ABC transporter ATP-binding protein [Aquabacter cavernae]
MNRLVIENLNAGYGSVAVLHDVCMEVRESEFVALLGTNGNGKSTLLNTILGFVRPQGGRILLDWDGQTIDLARLQPHEIVNAGVALVPEGRRLVPNLTVEENLILAGSCPRAKDQISRNLDFCYTTFPLLKERRAQQASTMSGGQQQLLAIARALMTSPRIMLIDEPSVGLAPIVVGQVFEAVRELQTTQKLTILMAEQSFFQAVDLASRAYVLSHGHIIRAIDRAVEQIDPEDLRAAMMGLEHS